MPTLYVKNTYKIGIVKKKIFLWKSRDQIYAQIMYILSPYFGHKVVITNFLYFNCLKYSILYVVTKVQLITNETSQKGRKMQRKHIFSKQLCVFSLNFGHEVSVFHQYFSSKQNIIHNLIWNYINSL